MNSNVLDNTADHNLHDGIFVRCPSNLVGNAAQGNGNGFTNLNALGNGCQSANNLF
jgi:hypothetical protein